MKKIFTCLLSIVLIFVLTACDAETLKIAADSIGTLTSITAKGNEYNYGNCSLIIRDSADVISDDEEQSLVSRLAPYCQQIDCDVLILTTKETSLSSLSPAEAYAKAYLPKDTEEWIVISFDEPRNMYYLGYDGENTRKALSPSECDYALNLGYGPINDSKFAEAFGVMAEYCLKEIVNYN